ncbi:MAG TPA: O-antigen ligase family protein [Terriglobia bacterium]|nr:O-antigen ligase family protein [Terriglobia bacterium]
MKPQPPSSSKSLFSTTRIVLIVAAVALVTMFALNLTPEPWAWESLRVIAVGLVLLSLFYFPKEYLKPSFVIWWMLLISECIFFREGDSTANVKAYTGDFPTAAYGEVMMWGFCLIAVLVFSKRFRRFFAGLFEGDFKWPVAFAALCIVSCVYTPRPSLGLVWGLKLCLVVLLLLFCSNQMRTFRDTTSYLRYTIWAFVIIVLEPIVIAIMQGQLFDEDGRMSTVVSPNALSPEAGVIVLLALTLYSRRKGEGLGKSAILLGIGACVVMILAASKTGILAGIIAGGLYFIMRRRLGSAMTFIMATVALIAILAISTPLGSYLHAYQQGEGAESLSGRTILWDAVRPAIEQKPVFGHGYMSSEFIALQVRDVAWAAPQLHNGFLEAAYNVGFLGFLLIVIINLVIPLNFFRVLRRLSPLHPMYKVAAGCLALDIFLLINGFFNSSFGGKATAPFMLLLGLLVVSTKLLAFSSSPPVQEENLRFAAAGAGHA